MAPLISYFKHISWELAANVTITVERIIYPKRIYINWGGGYTLKTREFSL